MLTNRVLCIVNQRGYRLRDAVLEEGQIYMAKALESSASAQANLVAARYNSCANRSYYACFQAAVAALFVADIRPANPRGEWSHEFVQSQFNGLLINRRKLYPVSLCRTLCDTMEVRAKANYTASMVSERVANRVLSHAQAFVQAIQENIS